jgi:hypothetical protein
VQTSNGVRRDPDLMSAAVNGSAPATPQPSAPFRPVLQYVAEQYPPELALRLLTFASTLPEAQAQSFLELLRAVDDAVTARAAEHEQVSWQQLVTHLPGLAPTLELLRAHVQGVVPSCTMDSAEGGEHCHSCNPVR